MCFNSFLDSFSRSQLRFITLFLLGRCTALNMIILLILIDHFAFGQKCPTLTCRSRFTLYPPSAQKKNPVEYVQGLAHNHLVMISCNDLLRFGYFVLFRSFPPFRFGGFCGPSRFVCAFISLFNNFEVLRSCRAKCPFSRLYSSRKID